MKGGYKVKFVSERRFSDIQRDFLVRFARAAETRILSEKINCLT